LSKPRFLLDENMPHALREALRRVEPAVDVQVMGEVGCPPLENEDLELLAWIERENRILVSRNRRTMPQHFATHLQAMGERCAGLEEWDSGSRI
jgi:predicted nuclease of predicted toxin-antitoxin system